MSDGVAGSGVAFLLEPITPDRPNRTIRGDPADVIGAPIGAPRTVLRRSRTAPAVGGR